MEIVKGTLGIGKTFQAPFPLTTICERCEKIARIAFVTAEGPEETEYISGFHDNEVDSFWPHDAIAVAIYFCTDQKCGTGTVLWNQG